MVRRVGGLIRKEFAQIVRDRPLVVILLWAFTAAIYSAGHGRATETMHVATAIYDLSQSAESREFISHLQPPYFKTVAYLDRESDIGAWLDRVDLGGVEGDVRRPLVAAGGLVAT